MSNYDYSLDTYFGGFAPNNIDVLYSNISTDSIINQSPSTMVSDDGNLTLTFASSLSGPEQSQLTNIIANHDNTLYSAKVNETQSIDNGDVHVITHFYDVDNVRSVEVKSVDTETSDVTTYTINSTSSSDYSVSDSATDIYDEGFRMNATTVSLGSNIAPNGTAFASSSTNSPSNGNDNSSNSFWYNSTSVNPVGQWWGVDFGEITGVYGAEFVQYSTGLYATDVAIESSNDNVTWTEIVRDTNISYGFGTHTFATFSSPVYARYFRFYAYGTNSSTYYIIREGRLFQPVFSGFATGTPSVIQNIEANKQINTSGWNTLNSSTITGSFPANTDTKVLVSFDNKLSWVYWNGSAWTTSSIANIDTSSMTHTVFNALTANDYASSNGLNSGTNTLDFAIQISTSSSSATPLVSGLVFNITSFEFEQFAIDSTVQVRYIANNKTEFKNISGSNKTFKISIS